MSVARPVSSPKALSVLGLDSEIKKAAHEATSKLAVFAFKEENIPLFKQLMLQKTPSAWVKELNEKKISDEQLKQLQIVTAHKEEYKTLFELPTEQWLSILLEEQISGDDLVALIGSDFIGAFSTTLDTITDMPNKETAAKALFYLINSPHASKDQINRFLDSIHYPEGDKASYIALHPIFHNTIIETQGYEVNGRPATETFLRIDPNHAETEQARVKAALRIMQECTAFQHKKILQTLPQQVQEKLLRDEDVIKKEQDKISIVKKDADEAKKAFRELNQGMPLPSTSSMSQMTQLFGAAIALSLLQQIEEYREDKLPSMFENSPPSRTTGMAVSNGNEVFFFSSSHSFSFNESKPEVRTPERKLAPDSKSIAERQTQPSTEAKEIPTPMPELVPAAKQENKTSQSTYRSLFFPANSQQEVYGQGPFSTLLEDENHDDALRIAINESLNEKLDEDLEQAIAFSLRDAKNTNQR